MQANPVFKIMRRLIYFLLIFTSTASANEYEYCLAKNKETYAQNVGCLIEESVRLNQRVEKIYSRLLKDLDKEDNLALPKERRLSARKSFVGAQKAWRKYSGAVCEYAYESTYGSGASAAATQCSIELTKQRIAILERW